MWRIVFVAILMGAMGWSIPAQACDCNDETLRIPVTSSQLEVWGFAETVFSDVGGSLVRIKVYDVLYDKDGVQPTEVVILDPKFCGVGFEEGRMYRVRAMKDPSKKGVYQTNVCTESREAAVPPTHTERARTKLVPIEMKEERQIERAIVRTECESKAPYEWFAISAAPEDDPMIQRTESDLKKDRPPTCLAEEMLDVVGEIGVEHSVLFTGSKPSDQPRAFVGVWGCEEPPGCRSFSETLRERLLDVSVPLAEEQARILAKQMHTVTDRDPSIDIARTLCRLDGVDAAEKFARNNKLVGGQRWDRQLETMLFECNLATRDFDKARAFLQTARPGPAFSIALEWLTRAAAEKPPIRTDTPTLGGVAGEKSLRSVRQAFLQTELWENDPVMLEAFAESVASDPAAPAAVRQVGALAYHKAALLLPEAAEPYATFARELAPDEELEEWLGTLRANHAKSVSANEARASLAQRAAAAEMEQLDLDDAQTNQARTNTRRAPILKDDDDGLDLDWGSLALHLLVIVGALSAVAFLASRGGRS